MDKLKCRSQKITLWGGGGVIYLEKSYLMGDSGLSIYNYKLIASVKAAKHNTKNSSSTLIMIKDFTKKMYNLRMSCRDR